MIFSITSIALLPAATHRRPRKQALILLCWLTATMGYAQSDTVRVVAASDLQFALTEIAETFEAAHPDLTIDLTFGSSGNFYTQLTQGLPADVYFSADESYPSMLEESGLIVPGTRKLYAVGRMVVWVANALVDEELDPQELGVDVLRDPRVTQLAIANPVHAPYGRGTVTLLESAGLLTQTRQADWEEMTGGIEAFYDLSALEEGKPDFEFIYGENISQAAQFALTSTGVGVVALSLAIGDEMARGGDYWLAPLESHVRLNQNYVILRDQDRPAVKQFYDYVGSPEAHGILQAYGFFLPGEIVD